jgi:hypothetical protein
MAHSIVLWLMSAHPARRHSCASLDRARLERVPGFEPAASQSLGASNLLANDRQPHVLFFAEPQHFLYPETTEDDDRDNQRPRQAS